MTNPTTFGQLLRHLRKRAGMTQSDLAAAAGYSVSLISALEKNRRTPNLQMAAERFAPHFANPGDAPLVARLLQLAVGEADHSATSVPGASSPPGKLLGRDADMDALCQRLMHHPGRLITLTGPPGIGKTSLALAVTHALAPFLAHGVCVVWLGAVERAELVAPAIASALGLVESNQPPAARLVAHLRRREMLLVIDNFEQVMPAAPLVSDLLAACPALRILITSRERLRLRAEQSVPLRPLENQAAVELFIARVRSLDARFELPPGQRGPVAEICRLLDDLPLAIELIASHALALPPAVLLERLTDRRLDLLDQHGADLPADQRTLTTALQRSYVLLTPTEQRLLRLLGVFNGGVSLDALEWLGVDLRGLQALANKSLVRLESVSDERRALLLETVRDFALRRLQEAGEWETAQARRLACCIGLAEQAAPFLHSAAQTRWLQRLEPDRYNFYAALQFALETGAVADAVRLCVALRHFWVARNHVAEIAGWLGAIHAAAEESDLDAQLWVHLLNCEGTIAFYRAEYAAANAHFADALARAEAIGDRSGIAYALDGLGAEAANRGDLPYARICSVASLEHSTALGDDWLAGITLMNLGEIARLEGDLAGAARHYSASLSRLQRAGDPFFVAVAQINLGQVYLHQGDLAQAEGMLRQSLESGLQAESVQVVAPALEKLAEVLAERDNESAGRLFSLALRLRQASGVTVQPVDQADYDRLADRLHPRLQASGCTDAVVLGARLQWPAIRDDVGAILSLEISRPSTS
jgi:predicted ATPase/DNA-binding XRE family transcriptional regulator